MCFPVAKMAANCHSKNMTVGHSAMDTTPVDVLETANLPTRADHFNLARCIIWQKNGLPTCSAYVVAPSKRPRSSSAYERTRTGNRQHGHHAFRNRRPLEGRQPVAVGAFRFTCQADELSE